MSESEIWEAVADALVNALHPEFGTEWQEGGILWNAIHAVEEERDAALAEVERLRAENEMARAEKAEAEVARLRDAVLAYCAYDDSHTDSCALWLPYPTGTEPACDCPVRDLRAALDGRSYDPHPRADRPHGGDETWAESDVDNLIDTALAFHDLSGAVLALARVGRLLWAMGRGRRQP